MPLLRSYLGATRGGAASLESAPRSRSGNQPRMLMSSPKLPIGGTRAGGGMARWASGRVSLHLRRVSVAGKPVGAAVRWFVHRPGFGAQGHLSPTAYLRGRAGRTVSGNATELLSQGDLRRGCGPAGREKHMACRRAPSGTHRSDVSGGGRSHSPEPIAP